jgi:hypothetical protein
LGIIVDAATVDTAYVEGAYPYVDLLSIERAEVDRLAEWPTKGMLGLRIVGCRSIPKEELRLDAESKCPDRFSLKVDVKAKPESLRDIGVNGIGKCEEAGDIEGGGLPFVDLLVDGRSTLVWSCLDCRKALKTDVRCGVFSSSSPKAVEFSLTYFERVAEGAFCVNTDGFSDEKAS